MSVISDTHTPHKTIPNAHQRRENADDVMDHASRLRGHSGACMLEISPISEIYF